MGICSDFYSSIFARSLDGIGSHHLYFKTFPTFFLDGIDSASISAFFQVSFLVEIGVFMLNFFVLSMFVLISIN